MKDFTEKEVEIVKKLVDHDKKDREIILGVTRTGYNAEKAEGLINEIKDLEQIQKKLENK